MWSISCNIRHLAQQHSQHKIQWSILWKRTFCHFRRANTANLRRNPHDNTIKWINARVPWRQKGSECWEHCAAYNEQQETHFVSNEKKQKWIKDNVDRETAVARKRVQDVQTAIMQEQEHMRNVEKAWSTTTKPETTFEKMLNAIGDSQSDLASSEDEEDGEDEDDDEEDTELGKLSEDDEPGWVMGTISKTVQHRMGSYWQMQMWHDKLTRPGWGDAAYHFHERDMKYRPTEVKVAAVVMPQTDTTAATPSPTTFGELMRVLDLVPWQSQMPQVTSRQRSSQMRLGSEKPQTDNHIVSNMPDAVPDSSQMEIATPVQQVSFYPSVQRR